MVVNGIVGTRFVVRCTLFPTLLKVENFKKTEWNLRFLVHGNHVTFSKSSILERKAYSIRILHLVK